MPTKKSTNLTVATLLKSTPPAKAEFKGMGTCFTPAQVAEIKKLPTGKYKRMEELNPNKENINPIIPANFSVLITQNAAGEKKYYGIERGAIGLGGFSKVRSLQDLETGEKLAGKLQSNNKVAVREQEILEQLGKSHGHIVRDKTGTIERSGLEFDEQHIMVIDLAPGTEIENVISNNSIFTPAQWLSIATQEATTLKKVHDKGILHCDIKTQNYKVTDDGTVSLIDYNISLSNKNTKTSEQPLHATAEKSASATFASITAVDSSPSADASPRTPNSQSLAYQAVTNTENQPLSIQGNAGGTPYMLSPQIKKELYNPEKDRTLVTYQPQDDIYSLGLTIGKTLGLAKMVDTPKEELDNIHKDSQPYFKNKLVFYNLDDSRLIHAHVRIPSEIVRQEILSYLKKMTAENPDARPSMNDVVTFFRSLELKQEKTFADLKHIAILNPAEYVVEGASPSVDLLKFKDALITSLAMLGGVIVVDPKGKCSPQQLAMVYRTLDKNGIYVMADYTKDATANAIDFANTIAQKLDGRSSVKHHYFNFTASGSAQKPLQNVSTVDISAADLYDEFNKAFDSLAKPNNQHSPTPLSAPLEALYQQVKQALSYDIIRLKAKYKGANKKVVARENLLNVTILALQAAHHDKTLTATSLDQQLENLMKVIPSNADTIKALKKLRDDCKKILKAEAALVVTEQAVSSSRTKRM